MIFISSLIQRENKQNRRPLADSVFLGLSSETGSALIGIIIAMTIVAVLGVAAFKITSSSEMTQVGSLESAKAYYLAESGSRHIRQQLLTFENTSGKTEQGRTNLINSLNNQVFSLNSGEQFRIQLTYNSANFTYTLTSTGMPNSTAARRVIYQVNVYVPPGGQDGNPVPFDVDPNDKKALNPDNWNVSGDKTKVKKDGTRLKLDPTKKKPESMVSLDWQNAESTLPNLADVWKNSNSLLSYEVQVKIQKMPNKDVVSGIAFRLNTLNDATASNDTFYGFSYLYCEKDAELPDFNDRAGKSVTFGSKKRYVVLWKQQGGVQTVLQIMDSPFDEGLLVVRVQEQMNGAGNRENLITCYIQDQSLYAEGTIHWDYSKFLLVQWPTCDPSLDCSTAKDCSCIVDTSLTSDQFYTSPRDEIGLFAFGDQTGKATFMDLAIRFTYNSSFATIQY